MGKLTKIENRYLKYLIISAKILVVVTLSIYMYTIFIPDFINAKNDFSVFLGIVLFIGWPIALIFLIIKDYISYRKTGSGYFI